MANFKLAALAAGAVQLAHAGIGYNVARLNPCSTTDDVQPYQQWTYSSSVLSVSSVPGMLWGQHASMGCIGDCTQNAVIWATPGGNMQVSMATSGSTTIKMMNPPNLCYTVLEQASPGAGLWLQPCTGTADQLFQWNAASSTLTHVASGLCVDAGSKVAPCSQGSPGYGLPFCDVSLSFDDRVADLVSRLSVVDKQSMLDTSSGGAPTLGVPPVSWWNEALHGIANNVGVAFTSPIPYSTSFPMAITTGCSFNRTLWHSIGAAISDEGRAFANVGHSGLTFWSPTINMFRDPRWGRGQETPGEDPLVSGSYATQYVLGMQEGVDPRYLKVSSCCKHFAAYSLEKWNTTDRDHFNAVVNDADLVDYYLQPFQHCIEEGRASAVMCSYNAVNGVPSCANDFLLNTVLRDTWQFDGYVTSDCGAVSDIQFTHYYTNNTDETAGVTLPHGMDIGCDGYLASANVISSALAAGSITESDLDRAIAHLMRVRFRLGEFDPAVEQPYTAIPPSAACSPQNIELARDGARQGMVLLSNRNNSLPLTRSAMTSVAVVGPLADNTYINGGPNYNGVPCGGAPSTIKTALQAAQPALQVTYAMGCDSVQCNSNAGFAAAVSAAQAADFTVVAVGIDQTFENEGLDRVNINLPGLQNSLVQQVCAAAKGPCILAIVSGGAQDISPVLSSVSAAYYLGLPGGVGADAFVDLVFGDAVPAGRMTQTTYPNSFINTVSLEDMGMRPGPSNWPPGTNPGRTYMWYTGVPVFPFGFGLSYTTFVVEGLAGPDSLSLAPVHQYVASAPEHSAAFAPLESPLMGQYTVNVTNTGSRDADYVVLGFLVPPGAGTNGVPLQQLFNFERVYIPAGQTVTVWLGLRARDLTDVVEDPTVETASPLAPKVRRVPVPGTYTVRVGVKHEQQEWAETTLVVQA